MLAAGIGMGACDNIQPQLPTMTLGTDQSSSLSLTPLSFTPTADNRLTLTPAPTPNFFALPIADDIIFDPSADPECQLPCWQGLTVGTSDRDDIQRVFDEVFGFHGTVDFASMAPDDAPVVSGRISRNADAYWTGYEWYSDTDEYSRWFGITLLVHVRTETLKAIRFDLTGVSIYSPQEIITRLGPPDIFHARVVFYQGEYGEHIEIELSIIYYRLGLHFHYVLYPAFHADLCLNGESYLGSIYILPQSQDGRITDLARWLDPDWIQSEPSDVGVFISPDLSHRIEVRMDEITRIATNTQPPCLGIDLEALRPSSLAP